ncbi:MAG: SDR family oxidoreductase [Chloroflexi bacterium]|nr:SDR family oxidoreductase [Chloroflexota bacterium]
MIILVTGSNGFIGKNLIVRLQQRDDVQILGYDINNTLDELNAWLDEADFVYHLAGVNRPRNEEEFFTGNAGLTSTICERLAQREDPPPILLSSSIQTELDNSYGRSKRLAEEVVARYGEQTGAQAIIYRLTNVFGKWSRPNYNTVVATFCYNIVHDLPITISNPDHELELIHIDDVVRAFLSEIRDQRSEVGGRRSEVKFREVGPSYRVTLGRLAELIRSFRESRKSLIVPDLSDPVVHKLYGMYLTYLDEDDFGYDLEQRCDHRGCLAEFVKSEPFGQIFVSRTKPGITRGNHFHHTKTEKFLVLEGEAIIRFRHTGDQRLMLGAAEVPEGITPSHATSGVGGGSGREQSEVGVEVIEYRVSGEDFMVLDIPPGYTHSIENVGEGVLVTLFWASEVFDPERMDTVWEEVSL